MNKRETIEYEIKARQALVDADTERINELEAKLEALEEPKHEHGDYGIDDGESWATLQREDQLELFGCECGSGVAVRINCPNPKTKLGNIFADLSRLQEPLENFRMTVEGGGTFSAKQYGINRIQLSVIGTGGLTRWATATLNETKEIIDELTRVYHTARKKSEKS